MDGEAHTRLDYQGPLRTHLFRAMNEGNVPAGNADTLDRWAEVCEALGATTKKLEKRAILAEYLRALTVTDAALAAQFVAGEPFAETDGRNLSVGGALLTKAVAARSGASPEAITQAFRHYGDIGTAAESLIGPGMERAASSQVPDLEELGKVLGAIASARGPASKLAVLSALLARCTAVECKYVLKLISGDMRIGVKQSLVEDAIATAYRSELAAVRHAGMLLGSLGEVVERAAAGTLAEARMRLFHPLGFMLASPMDSVEEAIARFTEEITAEHTLNEIVAEEQPEQLLREAQLEDKYDGIRAQLHAGDAEQSGRVGLFSRSREDLRAAFPELVEAFAALTEPVILDGEILAWSPETQRALPFSSLQQRLGRKQVSMELRRTHPVVFMAFDLLYADRQLWLGKPLESRRARLERYLAENAGLLDASGTQNGEQGTLFATDDPVARFPRLLLAPVNRLTGIAQLEAAYAEARARGNEGVMLKAGGSVYQPGRRGLAWLKLKRELATLDVVVTGAEFGTGRRAPYLSDYTFAVRGPEGDLLNVGKAYSGVTDAEMQALSKHFHSITEIDFGNYRTVRPDTIFEVAFNNITRSERHASGFALRFPRIQRIRTDKPLAEIDTLARVEQLYLEQPDKPVER